jgi:S-DNA-T family DNA segregation ATPase FtsK/SpoIIIE
LALRCSTRDASDTVLGAGWATLGYSATEFDTAHRGVGYLLAEGTLPTRMRCFMLEDGPLFDVARRAERLRGTDR